MTTEDAGETSVRLLRLRIRGFRSYGSEARELDLDAPLTVIKGENSQGKTATTEALEFLLTGHTSRRDLFGGAKAEYDRMLTNVHLSPDDEVWVEADIRCTDGAVRVVRRLLTADYTSTSDCESELTIDGESAADLGILGIQLGDPPLAAPVLLQHNLRYVLSTEPNKRATYFRSLLDLTDLDIVRNAVSRAKSRVEGQPTLPRLAQLTALSDISCDGADASSWIAKAKKAKGIRPLTDVLERAAVSLNSSVVGGSTEEVIADLQGAIGRAEEEVFPVGALTPRVEELSEVAHIEEISGSITSYIRSIEEVDAQVVRLTPIFAAVLNHQHMAELSEAMPCPVCGDGTLGPERIGQIREQLAASSDVQEAARMLVDQLNAALAAVDRVCEKLRSVLPDAREWQDEQWAQVSAHRSALVMEGDEAGVTADPIVSARNYIARASDNVRQLDEVRSRARLLVDENLRKVEERVRIQDDLSPLLGEVNTCVAAVSGDIHSLKKVVDQLHEDLGEKLHSAVLPAGTREVLDLLEHREDLHRELQADHHRQLIKKRVETIGRTLKKAEASLLDNRFRTMSEEIDYWWGTLRPKELVRFGGVDPRASGRRFVSLTAELAMDEDTSPQMRDALGVFSDSQLNALALSAFFARQRVLGSPFVILDDPLPGYDPEHQDTFAVRTVGALLDAGVQVILLSHNPRLGDQVISRYEHREPFRYRITLPGGQEGSVVSNVDEFVGRKLNEADSCLHNPSEDARKDAASKLRDAAERLAKRILVAGRSSNGTDVTVASIGSSTLGSMLPEVKSYAAGPDEPGKWDTITTIVNPGNHDDDTPSKASLRQARGEIKGILKRHEAKWNPLPR